MKKLLTLFLSVVLLAGCTSAPAEQTPAETAAPEAQPITVLCPTGAPAVALLPAYSNEKITIENVDGADLLQAAFVNPEHQYDVIIAPSNLGAKLAAAGKSDYKMLAVVTWGNLYMVKNDDVAEPKTIALFGEGAVPGLVYEAVIGSDENCTYYNAVTDAQAALLSGNADMAMLAEPAATATIAKGKEQGKNFSICADLQETWGEGGYPQAALFVLADKYEENKTAYTDLLTSMAEYNKAFNAEQVVADIEAVGAEKLGVPNAQIISKVYDRLGINIVPAADAEEALNKFVGMFGVESLENVILK
ncbi:MAG: hypothetical protein HUJ57_08265 [Erysipelotrichaceae bacterium]|nr:hypothetical protein [Erysipelotrichaceae bacterium]